MIKIIAIVIMILDHIGLFFYPDGFIFNYFSPLGIPLFSWLLVQGFICTKDQNKYLCRLLVFAIITQIPYQSLFPDNLTPNYLFTLSWGLVLLRSTLINKFIPVLAIPVLLHFHMASIDIIWIFIFYGLRYFRFNRFLSELPRGNINQYVFYAVYPVHFIIIICLGGII